MKLPEKYEKGYFVEAIDCTNFKDGGLRYEGLINFNSLNFLKWLSFKNNSHIDTWCLDRIAGQNGETLEYLDISGCNFTVGCVYALVRMRALKVLTLTDPGDNVEIQAAISYLEQDKPNLLIKLVD